MKKKALILPAVIAAFMAGHVVRAGSFLDVITGTQEGGKSATAKKKGETSHSFVSPADCAQGACSQQTQYDEYMARRAARRENANARHQQKYEAKTARETKNAEEAAARKAEAAARPSAVPARQNEPLQERENLSRETPVTNNAPVAPAKPKLGYPYTAD